MITTTCRLLIQPGRFSFGLHSPNLLYRKFNPFRVAMRSIPTNSNWEDRRQVPWREERNCMDLTRLSYRLLPIGVKLCHFNTMPKIRNLIWTSMSALNHSDCLALGEKKTVKGTFLYSYWLIYKILSDNTRI